MLVDGSGKVRNFLFAVVSEKGAARMSLQLTGVT